MGCSVSFPVHYDSVLMNKVIYMLQVSVQSTGKDSGSNYKALLQGTIPVYDIRQQRD
jgi:hypothetical protein